MITIPTWLSTKNLSKVYKRVNNAHYGRCILCSAPSRRALDLCHACEADLPSIANHCYRCAIPLPPLTLQTPTAAFALKETKPPASPPLCGKCLSTNPPQTRTVALYLYDFPIDQLITQLKFSQQMHYARVLGQLLAKALSQHYEGQTLPDAIIPVPLSKQRLRERGFNQASLLATPIAKILDIPLLKNHCIRVRHTDAQSGLNASTRRKNLTHAFALHKPLTSKAKQAFKHIALIDDVMTTGATLESLGETLLTNRVERVDFWTIARTPD